MSEANFAEALRRVLAHEGGYANHPADPGGPTKYGITIGVYRRTIKPDATADDIRNMPLADAQQIYRARYWNALRCDDLPGGIDYAVFDYGVNSGVARAGKVLRRVLGLPSETSTVTRAVVAAAHRASARDVVVAICDERLRFLKSLRTWPTFGAGWGRRVASVRTAALAMTNASTTLSVPSKTGTATAAGAGTVAAGTALASLLPEFAIWFGIAAAAVLLAVGIWWLWRRTPSKEAI